MSSRLVVKSESNASSLNKVILHNHAVELFGEFIVFFAFNKPASRFFFSKSLPLKIYLHFSQRQKKKNINRPSITVTFQGKMLPVCNWLSDHLLVLKGEVQMAQFLVCETGAFPTPSPPRKSMRDRQLPNPLPPSPPKKHQRT